MEPPEGEAVEDSAAVQAAAQPPPAEAPPEPTEGHVEDVAAPMDDAVSLGSLEEPPPAFALGWGASPRTSNMQSARDKSRVP